MVFIRKRPGKGGFIRRLLFRLLVLILLVTAGQVLFVRFANPPLTARMGWEWAKCAMKDTRYRKPRFIWKGLNEISPHLRRAVLAAEDQRFTRHNGFDFIELKKAIKGIFEKRKLRGASTVTMQVARTVYLLPTRSITRKLGEAYYTVLIELFWSKERILEVYLNTVDWGSGIMGAETAAMRYFHIHASDLNMEQAALMAAILPSPHVLSPARPNKRVNARKIRILKGMKVVPLLSAE